MKQFLNMLRRYARPYLKYAGGSVLMNVLSAVFNIFSFTLVIPLLQILFNLNDTVYEFIPWDTAGVEFKEKAINNAYWWVSNFMDMHGAIVTLLVLSGFMVLMTALKTSCYFGSAAVMVPMRTGLAKDLRMQLYNKILSLPLGFFSQERKGDIIARLRIPSAGASTCSSRIPSSSFST